MAKKKKLTKIQKIEKILKKKVKDKPILKKGKEVVLKIKKSEPIENTSRFFKDEWEETKKALFFK